MLSLVTVIIGCFKLLEHPGPAFTELASGKIMIACTVNVPLRLAVTIIKF